MQSDFGATKSIASDHTQTEVGSFKYSDEGKVVLSKSDKPVAYYKTHWLTWTWVACLASAGRGCTALALAKLSLRKDSPPLRDQEALLTPHAPPLTTAEWQAANRAAVARLVGDVHHWWTAPAPEPVPRTEPVPKPEKLKPVVPPFDLQDIPDVMDRLRLPVSAKMMRHWFAGRENYSNNRQDDIDGIDQNGVPYSSAMIDHDIIKLDWVLGFSRARNAYERLAATGLYASVAVDVIRNRLQAYIDCHANPYEPFNGLAECGQDVHQLHAHFQFQLARVDSTLTDKALQWLANDAGTVKAPDDLAGALGSFSIYAALGTTYISRVTREARVDSVYVYVRDSYSFSDGDAKASQYLGHWSTEGVYLAPLPVVYEDSARRWINAPLVDIDRSIYDQGAIMYPVSNKSFRDWRERHRQGGDFISYSRPRQLRLQTPIVVSMK
ncbi:MAG: hypothetical protein JWQ88_408 [Rhodoferax sp.]|nr:hypothetical protein [Rhodoferax sp.]